MYVIAGMKTDIYNDIWCGQYTCQRCGQISDFHLMKVKNVGSMFFIPFIFVTAARLMVCDTCGAQTQMKRAEYESLKKGQKEKLANNQFPMHIIQRDYNPKALKMTLKTVLFVLSVIFTVISLGFGIVFTLPVFISFFRANKKHNLYKRMMMSYNVQ